MSQYTDYYNGAATGVNATSATVAAGTAIDVSMRSSIGLVFTCSSHTSGNGVFSVDGSNDGTNWVSGIAMTDATATASTTFVTSKTLNSNTSAAMYLPTYPYRFIRVDLAFTTDGVYTATLEAKN